MWARRWFVGPVVEVQEAREVLGEEVVVNGEGEKMRREDRKEL